MRYLYLALDRATARDRVSRRTGHFMPARLVDSQFETLEPLERDEPGMTLDATADLPMNLARVRAGCRALRRAPWPLTDQALTGTAPMPPERAGGGRGYSVASSAASTAGTGMRPEATSCAPPRRRAVAKGAAHRFS